MYSLLQSPPPGQGSLGLSCSAPALAGTWHSSVGGHRAQATKPAPGGDKESASGLAVQPSKAQPPEAAPTPPAAALRDLGQRTQQTGGRAPPEARREDSALNPTTTPGGEAPGARPASAAAPQQDCWPGHLASAPARKWRPQAPHLVPRLCSPRCQKVAPSPSLLPSPSPEEDSGHGTWAATALRRECPRGPVRSWAALA